MTDPSFAFSLERVREVRVHEEDVAREAFAASLSVRARGAAALAEAQARIQAARQLARTEVAVRSGADLLQGEAWLQRLSRHQEQAELELDRHSAEVDARRAALTDAGRRREILERLKVRKRDEHRVNAARAEAIVLDEIALNSHVRKARA